MRALIFASASDYWSRYFSLAPADGSSARALAAPSASSAVGIFNGACLLWLAIMPLILSASSLARLTPAISMTPCPRPCSPSSCAYLASLERLRLPDLDLSFFSASSLFYLIEYSDGSPLPLVEILFNSSMSLYIWMLCV